ncbi:MAG TPA: M28 family peptidase [Bryobacteraceae bacterium]
MKRVYATDRWFTFRKFEETALYLRARLEESGLRDVQTGGGRADGHTQVGYWTMPLAWDAKSAILEVIAPEHFLLCDYRAVPTSLGMWSGPTPKDGITAELVDIEKTPWTQVAGKLVLTDKNSAGYKNELVKYHALGAVNGFSENPALQDGRQWVNAWGDSGWGFTEKSTPLLSFSITPRQARHVRELLGRGEKVMVHALADTHYYHGRYPWVTGVLPGRHPDQEVLVLGHTSEQGAQDNATGVATMVEAMNTLSRLVESGKLPRPERTIRILLMPELYGSLSYLSEHPERTKRTVAAITVDTPAASYDLAGTEYTLYLNPHVAMSYTDALILRVAAECLPPSRPWHWHEFMPGTDSYLGDPSIGIPDVWPYSGTGVQTHHNSEDKPETVDARSLRDLTAMIATYLYFNATAGEQEASWLEQITLDQSYQRIESAASAAIDGLLSGDAEGGSYGMDRVSYFAERGKEAVRSILRVIPAGRRQDVEQQMQPVLASIDAFRDLELARLRQAGAKPVAAKPNPAAEKIIVRRKRMGTLPLDDLPKDKWDGFPSGAWDTTATIALYWCDGKRNLAQIIHQTEMELGPTHFDFVGYFKFLERRGYVTFENESISTEKSETFSPADQERTKQGRSTMPLDRNPQVR